MDKDMSSAIESLQKLVKSLEDILRGLQTHTEIPTSLLAEVIQFREKTKATLNNLAGTVNGDRNQCLQDLDESGIHTVAEAKITTMDNGTLREIVQAQEQAHEIRETVSKAA